MKQTPKCLLPTALLILRDTASWFLQVTGDRNVPAGKVTLFTLDEAPTLGHYTGTELVDEGDTQPRPVGAQHSAPVCTQLVGRMSCDAAAPGWASCGVAATA